ncbi:MAG: hypothetical protein U0136_09485 [Bdellovibrionota bacterium]
MARSNLVLGSTLLLLSACSSLQSINPFSGGEQPASIEQEGQPPLRAGSEESAARALAQAEDTSTVEVLWQVPGEPVEKYHLSYGLDPSHLDNHLEIPVSDLQKIDHPKHGPVFRYELKNAPAHTPIYISLRAENKSKLSDPTPTIKIDPQKNAVVQ